jgi:tRNA A37 threonylcarbamoyladenosine dehydratase
MSTLGQPKVDVLAAMALDINPTQLVRFPAASATTTWPASSKV